MLDRGDVADRRVLHVEVVLADEHDRELPDGGHVERLVERADVRCPVAEEAHGHLSRPARLRRPGGTRGDRHVGTDDRVGAHRTVRHVRQVHRATLAAADPVRASEQLRHQRTHRRPAQQRVHVTPVRAEHEVLGLERRGEAGGDGLLADPEVRGSLHEALEEQVLGALLEQAALLHHPVDRQPGVEVRVVGSCPPSLAHVSSA